MSRQAGQAAGIMAPSNGYSVFVTNEKQTDVVGRRLILFDVAIVVYSGVIQNYGVSELAR